jgi:signal transduction histidine kinase
MKGKHLSLPPAAAGLSARLLLLTIAFVMLAEVLIYAPSIGRFRKVYLEERLADAHLAILALEATPDQMVSEELELELLSHVGAKMVALKKPGAGKLMLLAEQPATIDATFDLRHAGFFGLIGEAFVTLQAPRSRVLRVLGASHKDPSLVVEVVLDEGTLESAMIDFSGLILLLSLVISLFTAMLVYYSLHRLMVRPMRRVTESMIAFREDPEDVTRGIVPSGRSDEIGVAQRELATMQQGLRAALQQKTRLAALGIAVTKISHDLKNILATARLVSDRLAGIDDPEVRRVTPTLMSAIDRAVDLCAQTLSFTREGPASLDLSCFELGDLVKDVGESLPGPVNGKTAWRNRLGHGIEVEADRQQLFRVFSNLGQNAVEAGATRVDVSAERDDGRVVVHISDNGPGLPPRAREKLFQPFSGSARPGGTGLGLAIARDLVRAHGGEISLERSDGRGTRFRLTLPMSQTDR